MSAGQFRRTLDELARLREMHAQTTDPLALGLLEHIIMDLEAELPPPSKQTGSDTEGR